MELADAQSDLRRAYVRGGPGAVVAGVVWLSAAITASNYHVALVFGVLFFGGMLIFPVATIIVRMFFRRKNKMMNASRKTRLAAFARQR